ncbi:MAG: alpha-amylase [Cyanobacteria bacterium J06559_1]
MLNGTIVQCFHWYSPGIAPLGGLAKDDPAKDDPAKDGSATASREGNNLWQQIAQNAPELAQAGFSAVWLPPMTKGSQGPTDVGYSTYDLYDLGEFDQCGSVATKYGDRTELLNAIAQAHAAGLQVYGDVVLHRKHGGDRIEHLEGTPVAWREPGRAIAPAQTIVAHSRFTFPGRAGKYNGLIWQGKHFQRVNHNCSSAVDRKDALYRLKAKTFSPEVDVRLGSQGQTCKVLLCQDLSSQDLSSQDLSSQDLSSQNLLSKNLSSQGLPDQALVPTEPIQASPMQASPMQLEHDASLVCELDLDMPEVTQALQDWGQWLLDTTGIDGLRIDGTKHIPAGFIQRWLQQLQHYHRTHKAQTQNQTQNQTQDQTDSLFIMGDYWSNRINDLHWYIAKSGGQLSLFDVPLHYNFHFASRQGSYYDLRNILKDTLMQDQPSLAVTFVENHNSQPLQLLASPVAAWFKPLAYALILLRQEGYPCVFAGDYYGATYSDKASDDPVAEAKVTVKLPSYRWILDRLLFARSHCAYGEQQDYFERPNLIGWTRLGNAAHPQAMAVVMSNDVGGAQWMFVGKHNRQFVDITQHQSKPVWSDHKGWGRFTCQGSSVSVWVEVPA